MTELMDRLRRDHDRMRNVLKQVEVAAASASGGDQAAEDRLYCMLDYLGQYPHQVHHPVENIVFSTLLEHALDAEQTALVQENAKQHETLEQATEELLVRLRDAEVSQQLIDDLANYVELQSAHMAHEEVQVFPLTLRVLSEADWGTLAAQLDALCDPLFDSRESRYQMLYECLGVNPDAGPFRPGVDAVERFLSST